ncbi:MAG: non-homologous end-joining DNA ligase [Chitinophagales bacterium]
MAKSISASLPRANDQFIQVEGFEVHLTNQNKLYFPEEKIIKGDVVSYYNTMYKYMLPYLKDRPESLKRNPGGIKDAGFFHKDAGDEAPDWVKHVRIHSDSGDKDINYILCNNKATLLYMANLGCIEINPWFSRIKSLDNPDYFVIDIDPSPKNTFNQVIDAALAVNEVLKKAGIKGYCKTSGATGLHVYVPLAAKYTYDQVKDFSNLIAVMSHELLPRTTSLERSVEKRGNKIYMDYLQNRRGQTLATAYSLRPRPGATASAPLEWKEVKAGLHPSQFNITTLPRRVEKKGDLFTEVLGKGIDLRKCLKNLGA